MFSLINSIGRIPLMIAALGMLILSFFGWLAIHDHNLREEIIAEFNQKQEELLREKQEEFQKQINELNQINIDLMSKSKEKEIVIEREVITIEKEIAAKDKGNAAPDYYKELFNKMQKSFGENK
jgi:predicted metal-dependent hydrolase